MVDELTGDEAAAVFRRAAELDQRKLGPADALDVTALEQAGVEAGLSRDAIHQALTELRAGALALDEAALVDVEAVERLVAGKRRHVEEQVERFMVQQTFRVRRRLGDRTIWMQDAGLGGSLRRGLDLNKRLVLNDVGDVTTAVVEPPRMGRVLVRFEIDVRRTRRSWMIVPVLAGIAGAGAVVGFAAAGMEPAALLSIPAAGVAVAGGYSGAKRGFSASRQRTVDGVERFLDRLQYGR